MPIWPDIKVPENLTLLHFSKLPLLCLLTVRLAQSIYYNGYQTLPSAPHWVSLQLFRYHVLPHGDQPIWKDPHPRLLSSKLHNTASLCLYLLMTLPHCVDFSMILSLRQKAGISVLVIFELQNFQHILLNEFRERNQQAPFLFPGIYSATVFP